VLVEWHFWLAVAGMVTYIFAMWNSGIIQGLMWRTYNGSGTLSYSFIETVIAMKPSYVARAVGGLMFLAGAAIGLYNVVMTIRTEDVPADARATDRPVVQPAAIPALQPGE
jgi:cytochrome c oxidase cbb3-type subunit 1